MYIPRYFKIEELVDPKIIELLHHDDVWKLIDEQALIAIDALREAFGPAIINGIYKGATYTESGLRCMHTSTGAKESMHKRGQAFDLKFWQISALTVRNSIRYNQEFWYKKGIRRIEENVSWLHIDTKDTGDLFNNKIYWIPKT